MCFVLDILKFVRFIPHTQLLTISLILNLYALVFQVIFQVLGGSQKGAKHPTRTRARDRDRDEGDGRNVAL